MSILISALFLLLNTSIAGAARHNRGGGGHKDPPPPLQCYGAEVEAKGHVVEIAPALKKSIDKKDFKFLNSLASTDPVQVSQVLNLFKENSKKQIYEIKLDQDSALIAFKSLKSFVHKKKFLGPVPLKLAALRDKKDKDETKEAEKVISELNDTDLRSLKAKIVKKWEGKAENGDDIISFQLELKGKTLIGSMQFHDGTQDCLALDSKAHRRILPEGVDKKIIPSAYPLELPIEPPFTVTYFYGPRVFNSNNLSIGLERNPETMPKGIDTHSKNPMDYLNKYWQFHSGVDFSVGPGTSVYAPYDGVVFAMGSMGCAGNTMVVSHTLPDSGKVIFSVYEHLQGRGFGKVVVNPDNTIRAYRPGERLKKGQKVRLIKVGDTVTQGELIAHSGSSGRKVGFSKGFKEGCVAGPHLHFELRTPKDENGNLQKELAEMGRAHHSYDMGRRFRYVNAETVPVNPADFIYDVDEACQNRKNIEVENALNLRKADAKKVPPLTAGLCGFKYEKAQKQVPSIYRLSRKKNDLIEGDELSNKVANVTSKPN